MKRKKKLLVFAGSVSCLILLWCMLAIQFPKIKRRWDDRRSAYWRDMGISFYGKGDYCFAIAAFDNSIRFRRVDVDSAFYRMLCMLEQRGFAQGSREAVEFLIKKNIV